MQNRPFQQAAEDLLGLSMGTRASLTGARTMSEFDAVQLAIVEFLADQQKTVRFENWVQAWQAFTLTDIAGQVVPAFNGEGGLFCLSRPTRDHDVEFLQPDGSYGSLTTARCEPSLFGFGMHLRRPGIRPYRIFEAKKAFGAAKKHRSIH